ncbi:MAG: hypothetical protein VXX88_06235 [Pseudomonadota bacterium]|nr:hypothetical protein [Pseudomonadota bacterium]
MPESIEVGLRGGILCADFNEGCLIIDTGSPVSLGPDIPVCVLGSVIHLNSSFGSYAWTEIQEGLPFDAVGLIGVDAFSDAVLGFDVANNTLARLDISIDGDETAFVMGSPVVHCQIGEERLRCILDTGAGLSYLRSDETAVFGKALGKQHDSHPMLGKFEVETVACTLVVADQSLTETFGIATAELCQLMETANIDAILGTTFFQQSLIEIDFQNEIVGMTLD